MQDGLLIFEQPRMLLTDSRAEQIVLPPAAGVADHRDLMCPICLISAGSVWDTSLPASQ